MLGRFANCGSIQLIVLLLYCCRLYHLFRLCTRPITCLAQGCTNQTHVAKKCSHLTVSRMSSAVASARQPPKNGRRYASIQPHPSPALLDSPAEAANIKYRPYVFTNCSLPLHSPDHPLDADAVAISIGTWACSSCYVTMAPPLTPTEQTILPSDLVDSGLVTLDKPSSIEQLQQRQNRALRLMIEQMKSI